MPSRILKNNKVLWQSPTLKKTDWTKGLNRNKKGDLVDCAVGIAPSDPRSPFRAGTAYYDKEDEITYRVLDDVNIQDGWGTTQFWQQRWKIDHKAICKYVQCGYLDAVIVKGGQVRRYRCRDEVRLLESDEHKRAKKRLTRSRYQTKRRKTEKETLQEFSGWRALTKWR